MGKGGVGVKPAVGFSLTAALHQRRARDGHRQAGVYEGSVMSSASSWSRYCRFPTCKMGITHLCFPLLHGMHGTWPPLWQTLLLLLRPAEAVTVVPWGGQRWH